MRACKHILAVLVLILPLVSGCQKSTEHSAADNGALHVTSVNAICPIEGGPVDETVAVVWMGKHVGFCCAECIPAWNALSDDEKSAKLAQADEKAVGGEHSQHAE